MKYLRSTVTMPLTLEADGSNVIKWWGDASYAVHPDMRSHTGGVLSLGKGAVYATSCRQKLGTKSSTEAELVGVSDILPQVIWTRYFLEAQGYAISESVVYQDNQSAILLERNGRASSSKRTRHINIRYFFVTDCVANGEIKIEYCPTKEMLADYFTKPLQGIQFKTFRDQIMNINPVNDASQDYRSVLNVAEGEPWTDVGWTRIGSKTKETRHNKMATDERPVGINGYDGTIAVNGVRETNAMEMDHCKCSSDNKDNCMCDRKQKKGNQRLGWEIEHID